MSDNSLVAKLAKLWRKNSVKITEADPTFKTVYLGNVITQWAKGDGSVDMPLCTLWRNYCQSTKADIEMHVTVCVSGLKVLTRQHGLAEYWSSRLTYCYAHPNYPKVFCWVYRHVGRRLKPELRCHAVLCSTESKALKMQRCLRQRLYQSLVDYRKAKLLRQNARLSIMSVLCPAVPERKQCASDRLAEYQPPLERSRSAPRLSAIVEDIEGERLAMEAHGTAFSARPRVGSCPAETSETASGAPAHTATRVTPPKPRRALSEPSSTSHVIESPVCLQRQAPLQRVDNEHCVSWSPVNNETQQQQQPEEDSREGEHSLSAEQQDDQDFSDASRWHQPQSDPCCGDDLAPTGDTCTDVYRPGHQLADDWLIATCQSDSVSDSSSVPSDPTCDVTPGSPVSSVSGHPFTAARSTQTATSAASDPFDVQSLGAADSWADDLEDGGASDESGYSEDRDTADMVWIQTEVREV